MGRIVTFYSFKGGVGRTMALANIGVLLAQGGKSVLMIDWDLEAPGLHGYFHGRSDPDANVSGMVHLLRAVFDQPDAPADWRTYVSRVRVPAAERLAMIPAGSGDPRYSETLGRFAWDEFFAKRRGGDFIERLREEWLREYDFTLIDSRTGFTDSGGVCTIQLPDVLVPIFTANYQSLNGVCDAVRRAQVAREGLAYDRLPLTVLPLPSRFDGRVEVGLAQEWIDRFDRESKEFYNDWLPVGASTRRVVERTKVPHIPFFSFGEKLPVITHSLTDQDGVGYVYDAVSRLLAADFHSADKVLFGAPVSPTADKTADDLERLMGRLEETVESEISRTRRTTWLYVLAPILLIAALVGVVAASVTTSTYVSWLTTAALIVTVAGGFYQLRNAISRSRARQAQLEGLRAELDRSRVLNAGRSELLIDSYENVRAELAALDATPGPASGRRSG